MGLLSTEYVTWLRQNGVKWHNLEAAYVDEGWRGIVAIDDIHPGWSRCSALDHYSDDPLLTSRQTDKGEERPSNSPGS